MHGSDAVFDDYRKLSIKNAEREKRGAEMGNEYRSIRPDHRAQQCQNLESKQQLIHFIVNEWRKKRCNAKLAGKKLYATAGEECYEISSDGPVLCKELRSTQEEVDTRLLLHIYHARRDGCSTVVISSDDTDVFVLCLAFKSLIPWTVYMKFGTEARTRYIDITHVVQRHDSELCRCLPGLHAFTCCDSVSAFSG